MLSHVILFRAAMTRKGQMAQQNTGATQKKS
jgi:hypothetical protein